MSLIIRLLKRFAKPTKQKSESAFRQALKDAGWAVEFDPLAVTESVKADLRSNIRLIDDLDIRHFEPVYKAAVRSVTAGRDLRVLFLALMDIEGMTKGRAGQIALSLNNKATSLINRERQASLGITHAVWMYANAPCMVKPIAPTGSDIQQDAAHCAANGKRYEISKGLLVNGKWTWPGVEEGCKCSSRVVLPGLEE